MEATPEQIEAWKKQYGAGNVFEVKVRVSANDAAFCYLKKAGRNVVAPALSLIAANQLLKAGEMILDNCIIAGDARFTAGAEGGEDVRMAGALQAASVVELMEAEIRKL